MNRFSFIRRFVLALAVLVLPGSVFGREPSGPPKTLKITFSGNGSSTTIKLQGHTLVYTNGMSPAISVTPTDADWTEFRRALDAAKVWKWDNKYRGPTNVSHMHIWSVEIDDGRNSLKSEGMNEVPGKRKSEEGSYAAFREALKKLLGGRDV